jgi:hypothetical protein
VEGTGTVEWTVPPGWTLAAQGDFDADGQNDMLLRAPSNNALFVWLLDGTSVAGSGAVGTTLPSSWNLLGTADVDGNGTDDILWGNGSSIRAWRVTGNVLVENTAVGSYSGFEFLGAGDLDNDGDDDIVLRSTATGLVHCWIIEDAAISVNVPVIGGNAPGSNWEVRALGDINDDGTEDIIWRNKVTGQIWCWRMNGQTLLGGGAVGYNPGTAVDLVAVQDIDGDRTIDFIWKSAGSSAVIYGWTLNGTSFGAFSFLQTLPVNSTVIAP